MTHKLGSAVAAIVDCYGAFTATLATMHSVVAKKRCVLGRHVSDVQQEVVASTPVLVSTAGSLFSSSAMREVSSDAGTLGMPLIDKRTRTSKFEADMLIASV